MNPKDNKALTDKERAEIWGLHADSSKDELRWAVFILKQAVEFLEEEREYVFRRLTELTKLQP